MPLLEDIKIGRASSPGRKPEKTTVIRARQKGSAVLACQDVSSYDDQTLLHFITYGEETDSEDRRRKIIVRKTSFTGVVNKDNNEITSIIVDPGFTDIGNQVGDSVKSVPTAQWVNHLIETQLKSHKLTGELKDGIVNSKHLAKYSVTREKISWISIPRVLAKTSKWTALSKIAPEKVKYDTEIWDPEDIFDTNNHKAAIKTPGFYKISAQCGIGSAGFNKGTTAFIMIYVNGTPAKESNRYEGSGNDALRAVPSVFMSTYLSEGDVVEVYARCTDGRDYGGPLTGELLIEYVGNIM